MPLKPRHPLHNNYDIFAFSKSNTHQIEPLYAFFSLENISSKDKIRGTSFILLQIKFLFSLALE